MKLKPNSIYEYYWIDIHHSNDWMTRQDLSKEIEKAKKPVVNVGYFVQETNDVYQFTSGKAGDGDCFDSVVIPKTNVKKIILLKVGK